MDRPLPTSSCVTLRSRCSTRSWCMYCNPSAIWTNQWSTLDSGNSFADLSPTPPCFTDPSPPPSLKSLITAHRSPPSQYCITMHRHSLDCTIVGGRGVLIGWKVRVNGLIMLNWVDVVWVGRQSSFRWWEGPGNGEEPTQKPKWGVGIEERITILLR